VSDAIDDVKRREESGERREERGERREERGERREERIPTRTAGSPARSIAPVDEKPAQVLTYEYTQLCE